MAILKKLHLDYRVKASTLMETLVATVLIVIIFMSASMILNNIFSNSIKNNTRDIDTYLSELQYLEENNKLQLPYQEEFGKWQISIVEYKENDKRIIEFEASNLATNKTITIEQNRAE
jgi:predicted PurR-regulated permease PerM